MGSADQFYFIIGFFALIIVSMTMFGTWNDEIKNEETFDESYVGQNIRTRVTTSYNSLDNTLVMVYVFVHLGIIILAFLQKLHPVFDVVSIVLSVIMVIFIAPLANAYEDVINDSFFDNTRSSFKRTDYIMRNLIMFELVWFFITALVTYGISKYDAPYG